MRVVLLITDLFADVLTATGPQEPFVSSQHNTVP